MPQGHQVTGRCMCGAVEYSAVAKTLDVGVCHCDTCRKWSSGPYMAVTCEEVQFKGDENIGRIRSSDWAERGFCKSCGSMLFYHIVGSDAYQISAGSLDDQSQLQMSRQVFTDRKPDFYDFTNTTQMMTGEEVVAMYAAAPD